MRGFLLFISVMAASGCQADNQGSPADVALAYRSFEQSINKMVFLGANGFFKAQGTTIPTQTMSGRMNGFVYVMGRFDQSSSSTASLHLTVAMSNYSDNDLVYYTTVPPLPMLELQYTQGLGTLDGSLVGAFQMDDAEGGPMMVNLTMKGGASVMNNTVTDVGGQVMGSATTRAGTYNVNAAY
jgi:hypothetical protein